MNKIIKKIIFINLILVFVASLSMQTSYATSTVNEIQNIEKNEKVDNTEIKKNGEEILNENNTNEKKDFQNKENSEEINKIEKNNENVEEKELENNNLKTRKIEEENIVKNEVNDSNTEIQSDESKIKYSTHIQNIGWQKWKKDGELAGTEGKGYRLEAIKINLNEKLGLNVKYQVHVQNIGWQGWKKDGELAGTEGKGYRLEAIKIQLGLNNEYEVKYRVHIQNIGWQNWKNEGELAGTEGRGLRLEAIEIQVIKKESRTKLYIESGDNSVINSPEEMKIVGWKMSNMVGTKIRAFLDEDDIPISQDSITYKKRDDVVQKNTGYGTEEQNKLPGFEIKIPTVSLSTGKHLVKIQTHLDSTLLAEKTISFEVTRNASIEYQTHIQNIGWQEYVTDGNTSGTEGRGLRMEAIKLKLCNVQEDGYIQYSTHVEDIGWQGWKKEGELAGTEGKGKRIEAIKIELTGAISEKYDIYYRTHVQRFGWLDWAKNGELAGTEGLGYRLEAIQIKLVEKNTHIDTSGIEFIAKPKVSYRAHVENIGWQGYVKEGSEIGTTGRSLKIEAVQMKLENTNLTGTIQCSAHVQEIGWMNFVNAGQISGTEGRNLRLEAIKIKLTGELEKYFDIYYRTHLQSLGWISWAKNGEPAGSQGYSYRVEALQIVIVPKNEDSPGKRTGHFYNQALERKSIEGVKLVLGNICAGIDVSKHNGEIDWATVKNQSDFAVIRCAFGRNITAYDDKQFEENIQGCIANNIPIDVYLYSYAETTDYAYSEAEHVIRLCEKYKNYIRKVWYDVEDDSVFSLIRDGSMTKEYLGEIVDTFANRLESQGYSVGVYTYISALNSYFPSRIRNDYEIWIAHYPGDSQDAFENLYNKYRLLFKMWQFTSEGMVSGINGNVDISIRF